MIRREPAQRATSAQLIALVLAACGMMVALMQTLVVPMLPLFPGILDTSATNVSWLVTSTLLCNAVGTPVLSRAADMYGKRRVLLIALAFLVTGSAVGSVATNFIQVLIARCLQGFASAAIPVGISLMRDILPAVRVGRGVALMSTTLGVGGALGLALSGLLSEHWGWRSVFWVSGVVAALVMALVVRLVPESPLKAPARFDWFGAILLTGGLSAALLTISKGGAWGWGSLPTLSAAGAAVVLLALWLPWELRCTDGIVDIRTLGSRGLMFANLAALLTGFSLFTNLLVLTQHLQSPDGHGLTLSQAGLAMMPAGLFAVVVVRAAAGQIERRGPRVTMALGAVLMTAGYAMQSVAAWAELPLAVILATSVLVSIGGAFVLAATPMLVMGLAPIEQSASVNGVVNLVRAIGSSCASAGTAALLTALAGAPPVAPFAVAYLMSSLLALAGGAAALMAIGPARSVVGTSLGGVQRQVDLSDVRS